MHLFIYITLLIETLLCIKIKFVVCILTVTKEKRYATIWELNGTNLSSPKRSVYHDTNLSSPKRSVYHDTNQLHIGTAFIYKI